MIKYLPSHECPVKEFKLRKKFFAIFFDVKLNIRNNRTFSCPKDLDIQSKIFWERCVTAIKTGYAKKIEEYFFKNREYFDVNAS